MKGRRQAHEHSTASPQNAQHTMLQIRQDLTHTWSLDAERPSHYMVHSITSYHSLLASL